MSYYEGPIASGALTVSIYLDDGRVFEYSVPSPSKAREHMHAIVTTGYRHSSGDGILEWYPPHRIAKIKAGPDMDTAYTDKVRGT